MFQVSESAHIHYTFKQMPQTLKLLLETAIYQCQLVPIYKEITQEQFTFATKKVFYFLSLANWLEILKILSYAT
jgi:hypothetical protein